MSIYRLDIEFNRFHRLKEDEDLKFKELIAEFKLMPKKNKDYAINRMAYLKKFGAFKKFLYAFFDLEEKKINPNSYNLRKYHRVSYASSVPFLEKISFVKQKIKAIKSCFKFKSKNMNYHQKVENSIVMIWGVEFEEKSISEFMSNQNLKNDVDLYFYYCEQIETILCEDFDFLRNDIEPKIFEEQEYCE